MSKVPPDAPHTQAPYSMDPGDDCQPTKKKKEEKQLFSSSKPTYSSHMETSWEHHTNVHPKGKKHRLPY